MKYWDKAWSLIEGCTPVSPACKNCWLKQMFHRFQRTVELPDGRSVLLTDAYTGEWTDYVVYQEDRLDVPLKTKKPAIFAIWSDLFHEKVPANFIIEAFEIMEATPQHTYLICSKRPYNMANFMKKWLKKKPVLSNCFLATTVENQEMADKRIPELLKCKPFKLFLSIEPMLERINILNICIDASTEDNQGDIRPISDQAKLGLQADINYIIAGCESGSYARETKEAWIRDLRDQCLEAGIPLWIKQFKVNNRMVYNHSLSTINPEDLWK